jgi:hypothetical protein
MVMWITIRLPHLPGTMMNSVGKLHFGKSKPATTTNLLHREADTTVTMAIKWCNINKRPSMNGLILSVYKLMSFDFPFVRLFGVL